MKKGHQSIAIVVCYIGKLPWYFDYFVISCKYNPSISFFIVTDDNSYSKPVWENVKFVHKTLEEINVLAMNKLGVSVNIANGYKLCDFKPTYGVLFSDLLVGFDFWGHADLDVVFGDIREFITSEILEKHEIISVRHDFLTGQFLLFKNCEKTNNLYTLSKDYREVLSSSEHYCFDETNFQWQAFTEGKHYSNIPSKIESMTHLVKRLEESNYIKVFFDFLIVEGLPGKLRWKNGKLFYRNRYEILLYHLVLFKRVCNSATDKRPLQEQFTISPTRIYHR